MTTNEKDYSDYIKYLSNAVSVFSFSAGFTLTTITLLITLLPDPSRIMSQLTLFFLVVLFDLLIFFLGYNVILVIYFCRNVPPSTKRLATITTLGTTVLQLGSIGIVLMFLLCDLIYLALASGVVWALVVTATYIFTVKPLKEYRKTRAYMLGKVEKKEKHRN